MQPPPPANHTLDLTAYTCPMTFIKAKLLGERMAPGEVAVLILTGEEPAANLPRSLTEEGYAILHQEHRPNGVSHLWFRKSAL